MKNFFLTGPNRTGTTLLARCISDHPNCICLFESNINTVIFGGRQTVGHSGRMKRHGFSSEQTKELKNKIIKNDPKSFFQWYDNCADILKPLYNKPKLTHIGDKNPYFHTSKGFIKFTANYPKIWTIRDPRDVWYSGKIKHKDYLGLYLENVKYFLPHINDSLIIRFEDLIENPITTMQRVYDFLNIVTDETFLNHRTHEYDKRFAWNPNSTDNFDLNQINKWKGTIIPKNIIKIPLVKKIMNQFNYS